MEQPQTNTATCVIRMDESEVSDAPGSKPNPEFPEFATKIQIKFDPLDVAVNSQRAAFERELVVKKICVFIFVLISFSVSHVLGFLPFIGGFVKWSHLNLLASVFGLTFFHLLLWPFAMSNLSVPFFIFLVYTFGWLGLLLSAHYCDLFH
ncbi:Hypothetical predicted protein [Cloeon dipterum]|uniref:Uncharacterized protein n=1 Tax=Cloeon dipterum TaxID=197152 RepID=A0A8S1DPC4_9INSE|nr:Hypothetical predicted protein [Cloeon dipterum]